MNPVAWMFLAGVGLCWLLLLTNFDGMRKRIAARPPGERAAIYGLLLVASAAALWFPFVV